MLPSHHGSWPKLVTDLESPLESINIFMKLIESLSKIIFIDCWLEISIADGTHSRCLFGTKIVKIESNPKNNAQPALRPFSTFLDFDSTGDGDHRTGNPVLVESSG